LGEGTTYQVLLDKVKKKQAKYFLEKTGITPDEYRLESVTIKE